MPSTLTLPVTPSQSGYSEEDAFSMLEARFGDGYSQRVADGINHIRKNVTLTCAFLTESEKETLADFLRERGGYESFYYTLPSEASARLWTCREPIQTTPAQANLWNVTFKLREEFDLA